MAKLENSQALLRTSVELEIVIGTLLGFLSNLYWEQGTDLWGVPLGISGLVALSLVCTVMVYPSSPRYATSMYKSSYFRFNSRLRDPWHCTEVKEVEILKGLVALRRLDDDNPRLKREANRIIVQAAFDKKHFEDCYPNVQQQNRVIRYSKAQLLTLRDCFSKG